MASQVVPQIATQATKSWRLLKWIGPRAIAACAAPGVTKLIRQSYLVEDEAVGEGEFPEGVVSARGAPVSRLHDGLEYQRVGVGLEAPELRHVLGGLPVHHLAVVERGLHQHRRVGAGLQVVV